MPMLPFVSLRILHIGLFGTVLLTIGSAFAQTSPVPPSPDPIGEWQVAEGFATIRIVNCGGSYWGVVASEERPGGIDENNPDPAKRGRPTLGLPVLLHMTQSGRNEWSGQIYNSNDGRTYSGSISLLRPDVLRVTGCVLGFLCGGQEWARVSPSPASTTGAPSGTAQPRQQPGSQRAKPARPRTNSGRTPGDRAQAPSTAPVSPRQQTAEEICSRLVGDAGSPHQGGLEQYRRNQGTNQR
jgi:uncharacterized protein (DUF2147 family)